MTTRNAASVPPEPSTSDLRWAAWVARGVQDDRRTRMRAIVTVGALVIGLATWMAIVFLRE
jgi:hypothetical protein